MLLSYPAARQAKHKGPYVWAEGGYSFLIELGGTCEVPDDVARKVLERDGDVVKVVGAAAAPAVKEPVAASSEVASASEAGGAAPTTPPAANAPESKGRGKGGQFQKKPAYAQKDNALEE